MPHAKTPWYRWQINFGALYLAIVFGWATWGAFADAPGSWWQRLMILLLLGGLTALFAWTLWCDREPLRKRFRIDLDRPDSDDEAASDASRS